MYDFIGMHARFVFMSAPESCLMPMSNFLIVAVRRGSSNACRVLNVRARRRQGRRRPVFLSSAPRGVFTAPNWSAVPRYLGAEIIRIQRDEDLHRPDRSITFRSETKSTSGTQGRAGEDANDLYQTWPCLQRHEASLRQSPNQVQRIRCLRADALLRSPVDRRNRTVDQ